MLLSGPLTRISAGRGRAIVAALILMLLAWAVRPGELAAQVLPGAEPNIRATLLAEGPAIPGRTLTLAIRFQPRSGEWHGYWRNPGDAGYGMRLAWDLPDGWQAGEVAYPVPQRLVIGGLMNHVYEGEYAVLIPVRVPADAARNGIARLAVDAQWLACTDQICVPEQDRLEVAVPLGVSGTRDPRFMTWRSAIPPLLDKRANYAVTDGHLRLAVPLPAGLALPDPHVFIANPALVQYAAPQGFAREDDWLIADIPLAGSKAPPARIEGILAFGGRDGIRFVAARGTVPSGGTPLAGTAVATPPLAWLLFAALLGGLILNVMPCVFPVLSLKALSLARAGESEAQARREAVAYSAGVVLACVALGAVMLVLRAAGEEIGWAFQLQEPGVVVALLVLAMAITANLAGLYELPSIAITRGGSRAGAFLTGLLAAVVATPCTGPFMAAALGAALLLPPVPALLLFAALGLGLALPFLLLGFVPALRRLLPRPGAWMDTFRKIMAVPMALTAAALGWLVWRIGGAGFAALALALGVVLVLALASWRAGRARLAVLAVAGAGAAAVLLPLVFAPPSAEVETGVLAARPFSLEALAEARAKGRPVFVWLTADWCLTCKVNEGTAIERTETRDALAGKNVLVLRGDWTRRDPAITEYLAAHGAAGVPFYAWYAPGQPVRLLPQVLGPDTLTDLADDLPDPSPVPSPGNAPAAAPAARSG